MCFTDSEKEGTHSTHVHLTLSNTVHEADATRGNDHFARHLPEVCGGHPCHWTPARSKTIPWRDINSWYDEGRVRSWCTCQNQMHARFLAWGASALCSDYWAKTRQLAVLIIGGIYVLAECSQGWFCLTRSDISNSSLQSTWPRNLAQVSSARSIRLHMHSFYLV